VSIISYAPPLVTLDQYIPEYTVCTVNLKRSTQRDEWGMWIGQAEGVSKSNSLLFKSHYSPCQCIIHTDITSLR